MNTNSHIHYINGPREDAAIPRPGMDLIKGQVAACHHRSTKRLPQS